MRMASGKNQIRKDSIWNMDRAAGVLDPNFSQGSGKKPISPLTCWSEIFLSKHPKLQHGLQKNPSERHALGKSQSKRPWGSSAAAVLRAQSRAAGAGAVQGAARGADADKPVVTVVCES